MPESINSKIKEQYDHDDSGGSLDTNLGDFLDSEGASGTSNNSKWRDWASGTGTSLNTRLFHKHGGSGSFMTRWKNWIAFSSTHSFNFDNSNDYLDTGNSFSSIIKESFTMSAWIKPDDGQPSARSGILGTIENSGFTGYVQFTIEADGKLQFLYGTATAKQFVVTTTNAVFSDGATNYTHVAIVFNKSSATAGSLTIYANGSSVGTSSSPATGWSTDNYVNNHSLFIGATNTAGTANQFYDGLIDEVAVWDTALSASDVTSIYNNGKVIDLSKSASYGTDRTGNLKLWLRCGDKAEPESTTAIARQDFYTDFDGTNDYVVTPKVSLDFTNISISMWLNPDSFSSDDIFFAIADVDSNDEELILFNYASDSNKFSVFFPEGNNEDKSSGAIPIGQWTHLSLTKSGTSLKMYVNGSEVFSDSYTNTNTYSRNIILGVRKTSSYTQYFNGKISNVAIYKTGLDAQTIKQFAKSRFTPMRDNRFSVVDFDGSNDYIDTGATFQSTFRDSFSFSMWVKPNDGIPSSLEMFGGGRDSAGGTASKVYLILQTNGKLQIQYESEGQSASPTTSSAVFPNGVCEWTHLAWVADNSADEIYIYVNGVVQALNSSNNLNGVTMSNFTSADNFVIGAGNNDTTIDYFLDGAISSVAVYNTAKSAEEVYAIYQQGITYDESSLSGLVGYWKMGDDTSKAYPTIADSSSNSNDGTITNGASDDIVQQMVAGYDLGAFESSSEELGAEEVVNGTFDSNTNNWDVYLVSRGDLTWSSGRARIDNTTGTGNQFLRQTGQGRVFKQGVTYKIQFDHHVISEGSNGSNRLNFYWDSNQLIDVYNTTNKQGDTWTIYSAPNADKNHFLIGGFYLGDIYEIDNVSIKEVLQSADLSDSYPAIIDVNEPVLGVNIVDNNVSARWIAEGTNSDADITNGVRLTFGNNATGNYAVINDALLSTSGLTVGQIYKTTFTASYSGGSSAPSVRLNDGTNNYDNVITTTATSYEVYFKANSADGGYLQIINQVTSNVTDLINWEIKQVRGNVGTMTNQASSDLVYSSVLPDQSFLTGVNSAYNFIDLDGTDAFIDLPDDIVPNTSIESNGITLSAWINIDTTGSRKAIVGQADNQHDDFTSGGLYIDSSNRLEFMIFKNSSYTATVSSTTFSAGSWHHVLATYSGESSDDKVRIYVDGSLETTSSALGGDMISGTNNNNFIGKNCHSSDTNYFNGQISSVSIFNKQLSDTEVSAIYTAGRHANLLDSYSDNLKGYYAFGALDSKTGFADTNSTIYDRSGNSNHGTTSGTATGDLKSPPNAEPNGYAKGDTNRSTTTP